MAKIEPQKVIIDLEFVCYRCELLSHSYDDTDVCIWCLFELKHCVNGHLQERDRDCSLCLKNANCPYPKCKKLSPYCVCVGNEKLTQLLEKLQIKNYDIVLHRQHNRMGKQKFQSLH